MPFMLNVNGDRPKTAKSLRNIEKNHKIIDLLIIASPECYCAAE